MDVVNALPEGDKLLGEVRVAIESSGVLHGEFGRVEMLKDRKRRITAWLSDPREKVRRFSDAFIKQLDNQIASEQQAVEDEVAAMKHKYGKDESGAI